MEGRVQKILKINSFLVNFFHRFQFLARVFLLTPLMPADNVAIPISSLIMRQKRQKKNCDDAKNKKYIKKFANFFFGYVAL